jgi:DNA-binding HxlR family transcriptional regulator
VAHGERERRPVDREPVEFHGALRSQRDDTRREALLRNVLERVGDKWTLLVIEELGSAGELRFTQLRDRVGQVSQKMLTQTLRALERDGLVSRTVHPEVFPRVDYRLTARGEALGEAVCDLWKWVETHMDEVERSRHAYDRAKARGSRGEPQP